MFRLSIAAFALSILAPSVALANPPAKAQKLQSLVGSWSGKGTMEMGGQRIPVKLRYRCTRIASGFGVACDNKVTGIPGFTYRCKDMWGYDPGGDAVHWFTVSNSGETHDHKGAFGKDGFRAVYRGERDGKKLVETVRFSPLGKKTISFTSVVTLDGAPAEKFSGTIRKDTRRASRR